MVVRGNRYTFPAFLPINYEISLVDLARVTNMVTLI